MRPIELEDVMAKKKNVKKPSVLKRILKGFLALILVLVIGFFALAGYLTVTEFRPAERETVTVENSAKAQMTLEEGGTLTVLSFNIGYCANDKDHDFFMDGGKTVNTESRENIENNLSGIIETIKEADADVNFIQEVDKSSKRSYHVNEYNAIAESLESSSSAYATNYRVKYVPYPLPTIGEVESGVAIFSKFTSEETALRVGFPTAFSWPVSLCQLKRCLLVEYVPIENSDKMLVLVNLHLDAYDDGEGKKLQTQILSDFLKDEYEKGNYVIAGGDFNQTFPDVEGEQYEVVNDQYFVPGVVDTSLFPEGWQIVSDDSVPSARLLNEPYNPESENTQYYVLDGFILSPNVKSVSVETLDCGFENSDHNPVVLTAQLGED